MDGMGWLGWSEQQTLDTPIPVLELAMRGRLEMLKTTNPFGSGETEKPVVEPPSYGAVTAALRAAAGGDPKRRK